MPPDLNGGLELRALLDTAQPNDYRDGVLGCGSPQWRAAFWAEHLGSPIAALSDLDVALGRTVYDQALHRRGDDGPERCPGENLAVAAMAHRHTVSIDFRRK